MRTKVLILIGLFIASSTVYFTFKAGSSTSLFDDVQMDLFNNTNSTIIGDVGHISGDLNVDNN